MSDPREEYAKRVAAQEQAASVQQRRHIWIGNTKLAVVALGLMITWLSLSRHVITPWWLFLPTGAYAALSIVHELTIRARARAERVMRFYLAGIARIEDRWMGSGQTGERFRAQKHVYAEDLDLFGPGSLFELLSIARLPMGEDRLADWLRHASPKAAVLERQKFVAELRDKLDLREDLAVLAESAESRLNPEALTTWAEGERTMPGTPWRLVAAWLSAFAVAGMVYYFGSGVLWPMLAVFIVEGAVLLWLRQRAKAAIRGLDCNAEGLQLFSEVLRRIEKESFASPRLQQFAEELTHGEQPASRLVRRLARIVYWVDSQDNLLVRAGQLPLLYTVQVAFAADAWRERWGRRMRRWVEIAGEIEALLSLATYAYEHPRDAFPELVGDEHAGAIFDGEELGHPLIPEARSVRNSIRLDADTRLLLVSGSNMSGKSTLLRVVGVNTVLALAGAPIRGGRLRLTPLLVGTRIRSTDSLQEQRSSFFTEILHIRDVFELTGEPEALLFLFDELLEGTNSRDRRIGAAGLLRSLMKRGAIGIVTTHDLALTEIAGDIGATLRNMHFQDEVIGGKMRFDYKLRDGVVTKSNAIDLMRLVGLEV